ncbi:MAG: phage tail assembly chaperone G [Clostridium sp.]
MNITLEIDVDGEMVERKYSTIRMRGRALKRMLEIQDVMKAAEESDSFTQEHYDLMCEFICEMHKNEFTVDQLLDGMDLEDIYPTFSKLTEEIANKTMKKMDNLIKK